MLEVYVKFSIHPSCWCFSDRESPLPFSDQRFIYLALLMRSVVNRVSSLSLFFSHVVPITFRFELLLLLIPVKLFKDDWQEGCDE